VGRQERKRGESLAVCMYQFRIDVVLLNVHGEFWGSGIASKELPCTRKPGREIYEERQQDRSAIS